MAALVGLLRGSALATVPSVIDVDALARATGNDRADAVHVARALLARKWAAQITRVRVDSIGSHRVAGITLLGVKLNRRVDPATFYREANEIVDVALRTDPGLEEVDLRATVPAEQRRDVGVMDEPLVEAVFTMTVRREARGARDTYWDPAWRAALGRT